MSSPKREAQLDGLLEEFAVDHLDWPNTYEELDEFLLESSSSAEEYDESAGCNRVHAVIVAQDLEVSQVAHTSQQDCFEGTLFKDMTLEIMDGCHKTTVLRDLHEIVGRAYRKVFEGWSIDRLIADPQRNAFFVQACWALGAQASQFELNRTLLNARKCNAIGRVKGVTRYSVPREVMDQYLFASEVAVRLLQDQEFFERQRFISLDHILCDPDLGQRFEALARMIAPGFESIDYRWAALTLRKSQNRSGAEIEWPTFERIGSRQSIRASAVPRSAGFFWMRCANADIYIGHAQNLREQIERMLDMQLDRLPPMIGSLRCPNVRQVEFSLAVCSELAASYREPVKTSLVKKQEPLMNVLPRGKQVA